MINEAKFTEFEKHTNWCGGTIGEYKFEAKLFDNGSVWGINDGRVSKLSIWNDNGTVVNYDRGWDIKPTKEIEPYYNKVMELLENAPKRFSLNKIK